jgi:N-acetylmuramic acid 6-phosphate etherase
MTSTAEYNRYAHDPDLRRRAAHQARRFIHEETQFQLGFLPTEQSHPLTEDFAERVHADPEAGIGQLLQVDLEIAPVARRAVLTPEFDRLVAAIRRVAAAEPEAGERLPRICFSGCGSTGRLSIMLEEMWRRSWEEGTVPGGADGQGYHAAAAGETPGAADDSPAGGGAESPGRPKRGVSASQRAEQACSIMTGGDRALIRAVENFEDYRAFGARQLADLDLQRGDVLIAVSEGGETSSVIGTAEEALRRGLEVFFVFNNPAQLLSERIERSRRVIEDERVTVIDLFTGPMALSGSTRMQATSAEMLVIGLAQEEALASARPGEEGTGGPRNREQLYRKRLAGVDAFSRLTRSLLRNPNRRTLARLAADEAEIYRTGGRITYFAADFLLDIFSDTTERSPTFMLPPFRPSDDADAPVSWAYAKNPGVDTPAAWTAMLRRRPRGIGWSGADYAEVGAPTELQQSPPQLDLTEIHRYTIGREPDESRWTAPNSAALCIRVDEPAGGPVAKTAPAVTEVPGAFARRRVLSLAMPHGCGAEGELTSTDTAAARSAAGPTRDAWGDADYRLEPEVASSITRLFHHLAVKLIFNTLSTASMGILGRIRGNWMIQVDPTNKKLIDRGSRIISHLAGLSYEDACVELHVSLEARREAARAGENSTTSPVVAALQRLESGDRST